ncbi:hypothetical protein BB561_003093 [Smittium simulii]|uniref:Cyanovirin-N domain-containing protein n=1 Tax=Smittium simulii TaxID=133385 RepID=A0A2T9YMZ6_9FUNG|nr:hypothetical protein BB561_003093 [Smittium simulii]
MRVLTFSAVLVLITLLQGVTSDYTSQPNHNKDKNQSTTQAKRMCAKVYGNGRYNFFLQSGDKCNCRDDGQFRCAPKSRAKWKKVKACINRSVSMGFFNGFRGARCICDDEDGSMICFNRKITPVN